MDKSSISIFLPLRSGSKRIIKKNTRSLPGFELGLLEIKLKQLLPLLDIVSEIVISTDDEIVSSYVESLAINRLKLISRSRNLANDSTKIEDLCIHAGEVSNGAFVLWTHVTSPFYTENTYRNIISTFKAESCCGLVSGVSIDTFLLHQGKIINSPNGSFVRTQDLLDYFAIDSGCFITPKNLLLQGSRLGENFVFFKSSKSESIDVDWIHDFNLVKDLLTLDEKRYDYLGL
jgi:CMP-N-acetylneuraminic acid synthetase